MKKAKVKVNFETPNRPKFYKELNNKWVGISKQEFEEIIGHKI